MPLLPPLLPPLHQSALAAAQHCSVRCAADHPPFSAIPLPSLFVLLPFSSRGPVAAAYLALLLLIQLPLVLHLALLLLHLVLLLTQLLLLLTQLALQLTILLFHHGLHHGCHLGTLTGCSSLLAVGPT